MAKYRTISMAFWTDPKITDDFTPEDKYFYLYLMTNPHTNLCGCYELSLKQASDETGYSKETIDRLLERFQLVHEVIIYCKQTKEVYIKNWSKYNWTTSEKFTTPLLKEIELVKSSEIRGKLIEKLDTVSIPYTYPTDTPDTDINNNNNLDNKYKNEIKEIIDYLNIKCNTKYRYNNKEYNKHIRARLGEGFSVDDFKTVIDVKSESWLKDERMRPFLRPQTLFCTRFESYLNEMGVNSVGNQRNAKGYDYRDYYGADAAKYDGNDMPFV